MNKKLVIAIDGPSASGKGTLAKKIAQHFDLSYLNTGAIYRAVAYKMIELKMSHSCCPVFLCSLTSQ